MTILTATPLLLPEALVHPSSAERNAGSAPGMPEDVIAFLLHAHLLSRFRIARSGISSKRLSRNPRSL